MSSGNDDRKAQVKRLQDNLAVIRKIAGWKAAELGDLLDVTKQTISNIENDRTPMTLTLYIVIRAILENKMEEKKENTLLRKAVYTLIDNGDELNESEYNSMKEKFSVVAAAADTKGVSEETLKGLVEALGLIVLGPVGAAAVVGGAKIGLPWLKKLTKKN